MDSAPPTIALVGNPNSGKTTLFNQLTGLRAHTANFAGTTVEYREGPVDVGGQTVNVVDLPGLYSLDALSPDERAAHAVLTGEQEGLSSPDALVLVVDVTNLSRNLFLASQVIELCDERDVPLVVALNMSDVAQSHGLEVDLDRLTAELTCPVVNVAARDGHGIDDLLAAVRERIAKAPLPELPIAPTCGSCKGCGYSQRHAWAEDVASCSVRGTVEQLSETSERLDRWLTHPVIGLIAFASVMLATFLAIFVLASWPMEWLDLLMGLAGSLVGSVLPEGDFSSLVTDGIIGGVGGMLVFLPQICILFFLLALLEDSGYLSRAAFVMDRLMYRVGLPGKAFVPMLSAHACAIPAIMSTRVIEDRRDRLATILVLPLMTCSARLPVYAMVMALLFPTNPIAAATIFAGAYALGIVVALVMAWIFKRTILPGQTRPLVIELPNYRRPSLYNAFLTTVDRAWAFIKNAGTVIFVICVVMWALATYPKTDLVDLPAEVQTEYSQLVEAGDEAAAENMLQQAQLERSIAGRLGRGIQPIFAPLGFDWKMSIGVLSSFAAREVVVSNLSVLYGLGEDGTEDSDSLYDSLRNSRHADGSVVFSTATCLSLLVFYVLAMQCLPTQAITKRETGSWNWALLQLGYMTVLAYVAALVTYQATSLIT